MVRHEEGPFKCMISPSEDADRGLSTCCMSDGGSQPGSSEGPSRRAEALARIVRLCQLRDAKGWISGWSTSERGREDNVD